MNLVVCEVLKVGDRCLKGMHNIELLASLPKVHDAIEAEKRWCATIHTNIISHSYRLIFFFFSFKVAMNHYLDNTNIW